jgi:hypothetical protein
MSDIVNRLRSNRECLAPCLMDDAAAEIERLEQVVLALTAERDEARQMYCNAMTDHCEEHEARQIAKEQGWDCFPQEDGK